MFEAREHTWVVVVEPCELSQLHGKADHLYWGSKDGYASLTDDIAQATHFKSAGAAKSKITSLRGRNYGYLYIHKDDKVYVGEIDSQVTVKEAQ